MSLTRVAPLFFVFLLCLLSSPANHDPRIKTVMPPIPHFPEARFQFRRHDFAILSSSYPHIPKTAPVSFAFSYGWSMRDLLIPLDTSSYLANDLAQVQRSTMAQCLRLSQIVANPEKLVFSHSTALKLLGISLPISRNHLQLREFHICVQKDSQRRKPTYVHSHVWKPADEVMPLLGTMACVSPLTAWAQMSQHLSVPQLVVLGDSMMRRNADLKWLVPYDFSRYLQSHKNF